MPTALGRPGKRDTRVHPQTGAAVSCGNPASPCNMANSGAPSARQAAALAEPFYYVPKNGHDHHDRDVLYYKTSRSWFPKKNYPQPCNL